MRIFLLTMIALAASTAAAVTPFEKPGRDQAAGLIEPNRTPDFAATSRATEGLWVYTHVDVYNPTDDELQETIDLSYDNAGRLLEIAYSDGENTTRTYDSMGRLESEITSYTANGTVRYLREKTIDRSGDCIVQTIKVTYNGETTISIYTYDDTVDSVGRLTKRVETKTTDNEFDYSDVYTFEYGNNIAPSAIQDIFNYKGSETTYRYDNIEWDYYNKQIVSTTAFNLPYAYKDSYRPKSAVMSSSITYTPQTWNYTYDGDITTKTIPDDIYYKWYNTPYFNRLYYKDYTQSRITGCTNEPNFALSPFFYNYGYMCVDEYHGIREVNDLYNTYYDFTFDDKTGLPLEMNEYKVIWDQNSEYIQTLDFESLLTELPDFDKAESMTLQATYRFSGFEQIGGAGIETVADAPADAPAEYFTLQGIRTANPHGLVIERRGTAARKLILP